jgi:hypothetical protein
MQPLVKLVPVDEDIVTAYNRSGAMRAARGRMLTDSECVTVGEDRTPRTVGRWLMVPGAAHALGELHTMWIEDGARPFRVTDMLRPGLRRRKMREGFEQRDAAGRPPRGTPGWRPTMHDAVVAPQNGSFHGCGCAVDFQSGLLNHPKEGPIGGDEALERFWELMQPLGFTPIIAQPIAAQSESWHIDWMGPLARVRNVYRATGRRGSYSAAAEVGTLLTGQWLEEDGSVRRVEIRTFQAVCALLFSHIDLLEDTPFVGRCDGVIGPLTRANEATLAQVFDAAGLQVQPVWRDMLLAMPELIAVQPLVREVFEAFNGEARAEQGVEVPDVG